MGDRLAGKVAIVTGAGSSGPGGRQRQGERRPVRPRGGRGCCSRTASWRAPRRRARRSRPRAGRPPPSRPTSRARTTASGWCAPPSSGTGGWDVLHNNVGISTRADVLEVTGEQWDHVMTVNVKSIVLASKHAIPEMKRVGRRIDHHGLLDRRAAGEQQHAVHRLQSGGDRPHEVDGRRPRTRRDTGELHRPRPGLHADGRPAHGRRPAPDSDGGGNRSAPRAPRWDVAWAAVYLASDEARWVTGIVLPVDAGLLATTPVTYHRLGQQRHGGPGVR